MNNNNIDNDCGLKDFSVLDIINMPAGQALKLLISIGAKAIVNIKQTANEIFSALSNADYEQLCIPVLTMDTCINWLNVQRESYPNASYFFIYTKENMNPRNENDKISVTLALLDSQKKTISSSPRKNNKLFDRISKVQDDIVCIVIPTRTLDHKLVNALNGSSSVLVKL